MKKIDQKDIIILKELSDNANISIPKLAKKTNLNQSFIYSRLDKLTKNKTIKQFTIRIDNSVFGYNVYAIVGININTRKTSEVIDNLKKYKDIITISEVSGRFDLFVRIACNNLEQLHKLIIKKIAQIEGVNNTETFIELKQDNLEHKLILK